MNKIVFSKYEGLGNDFIIIDESQDAISKQEPQTSLSLRRDLCNRKLGIGADGVITLLPAQNERSLVFMHVTNSDGSIPENCGNGLRCVARFLFDQGRVVDGQEFGIDTYSGTKRATVTQGDATVELGIAIVKADVNDLGISKLTQSFAATHGVMPPQMIAYVDLGNQHLVLETDDFERAQIELGPLLEKSKSYPNGANVSFVKMQTPHDIHLRVWERGAGATDACGSGAGASVAAFVATQKLAGGFPVSAHFKNGVLKIRAKKRSTEEFEIEMSGPARKLFDGAWENFEKVC